MSALEVARAGHHLVKPIALEALVPLLTRVAVPGV
jgi:hypothetical protein